MCPNIYERKLRMVDRMLSPFLKKLLFARQLHIADGQLEILGQKQVMLPASALAELQSLNPDTYYQVIKKNVQQSMALYAQKIGVTNEGILNILEQIFETYGIGKPEVVTLDNAKHTAVVRIRNTPFGTKNQFILPGAALAGMFSYLFKKNMDCTIKATSKILECRVSEGRR